MACLTLPHLSYRRVTHIAIHEDFFCQMTDSKHKAISIFVNQWFIEGPRGGFFYQSKSGIPIDN